MTEHVPEPPVAHQDTVGGPLSGVKVLDFTRVFAGPFATQILGDLGADVTKVERIEGGDEARDYGVVDGAGGMGPPFLAMNRNKKSIAIDLKHEAGKQVTRRLLASTDVVVHNFRSGVMERLGLDYATVAPSNPAIIYCSISGYGGQEPLRSRAANDLSIQAYSGLLSITGEPGGPPVRNPTAVCDQTSGLYAVIGILSALLQRHASARGQEVETSMLEGQLNMLNHFFVSYWEQGVIPVRMGTANALGIPNQAFPTNDGWVCITTANESLWARCCEALGVAHLATDERFQTLRDRYRHRPELIEALSAATTRLTTADCVARLGRLGVPCAPVNTIPEVASDPHVASLGTTVEMPMAGRATVRLIQTPLHFSDNHVTARLPPPRLGEHTDQVLLEEGFSPEELTDLRSTGVIN
jgi:crotonobetainyl-CoA:carnitine CoA-transferase CaiB-like acyl-CoA transferase